jgi:hypothetical protein
MSGVLCGILAVLLAVGAEGGGKAAGATADEVGIILGRPDLALKPEAVAPDERAAVAAVESLGARLRLGPVGRVESVIWEDDRLTDGEMQRLASFPALASLCVSASRLSPAGLRPLLGLAKLRELDLSVPHLTGEYLDIVAQMPGIETLGLGGAGSGRDIPRLRPLRNLKSLSLGGSFTDRDVTREVAKLESLRRLFVYSPITPAAMGELRGLAGLETLDVYPFPPIEVLAKIGEITSLKRFGRSVATARLWTDARLEKIQTLTNLGRLYLDGSNVTDGGMLYVGRMVGLEFLSLSRTKVGDAGLAHLRGLRNLKQLNLEGTTVTDAGLGNVAKLPSLLELNLRGTKVSDAGMPVIAKMRSLRSLDLYQTTVTDTGARALAKLQKDADPVFSKSIFFPEAVTDRAMGFLHERGVVCSRPLPALKVPPGGSGDLPPWARPSDARRPATPRPDRKKEP